MSQLSIKYILMTDLYSNTFCVLTFCSSPLLCPQNIFAMDLRSANKVSEKPTPRLRLSLTRAMSTDVDQGERGSLYRRLARRKIKQRLSKRGQGGPTNKTLLPLRKKAEPIEEDWGTSEEEKQESESTTEEIREDSLYGWFVKSFPSKSNSLVVTFDFYK